MTSEEQTRIDFPREPIQRVIAPLERFLHIEAAGGIALLSATATALILANSPLAEGFLAIWKTKIGFRIGSFEMLHSLKHWINDGLMAIFFFVMGLEVKRELVLGELRDIRRAALPIAGAVGGMLFPAGIYLALQGGKAGQSGWGIPMATDIAFVVGCLAILGSRVPNSLRVMLVSLAIADDIGAILVIAIGYTESLDATALLLAFSGLFVVLLLARIGVRSLVVYTIVGAFVWGAFHESGIHATIAGVLLGLLTPARSYVSTGLFGQVLQAASDVFHGERWENLGHRAQEVRRMNWAARETISPLEYLEGTLHPWVGFAIMPIFAFANAGVPIRLSALSDPVAIAVMLGLVVGKPAGICCFCFLAVRVKVARLPEGMTWGVLAGAGCLAGIGFTMAIFIAGLALDASVLDAAKIGILGASVLAAAIGMGVLLKLLDPRTKSSPSTTATEAW